MLYKVVSPCYKLSTKNVIRTLRSFVNGDSMDYDETTEATVGRRKLLRSSKFRRPKKKRGEEERGDESENTAGEHCT